MLSSLFSISNRVILVSGGSSGIGNLAAKGLAEHGAARVYIVGRRVTKLEELTTTAPGVIIPIVGDVSTIEGCQKITASFVEKEKAAGIIDANICLDLLFSNASISAKEGVWPTDQANPEQISNALLQASDDDWSKHFAINASATQLLSASFLPYLARAGKDGGFKEGRGCIVVNTSISAFYISSDAPLHIYTASKFAAESIAKSLASNFTKLGVRVNTVAIGNIPSELNSVDTSDSLVNKDKVPIGRCGSEDDIVGTLIYLASRAGSYVSGATIILDGGTLVASR
ncbi:hypothetical protein QCA50_004500 [Cerrena zonata]|uniref:NAD(P)-binding protein n=1 Tax=Cerrena zonata TaxID=2478898 RepID=A0AAW0GHU9_9APHY